jgi:hypothetical protein
MYRTHQHVVCADVNLLGENVNTVKKDTALLYSSENVHLEVNVRKIKYIFMSSPECREESLYKDSL